jgi:aldehyde dehydrogenase (NAD+)
LVRVLDDGAGKLTAAMKEDLGKPEAEAWLTDLVAVRRDIRGIIASIERWAAPRHARVPWPLQPARASVVPEPLGAVLVIGPWNYPVRCTVLPLAFAIAAGNTAALKPSELAPTTSRALAELLGNCLDPNATIVVEGGAGVAEDLLSYAWGHVFFTGGARTGRLVMAAAAKHLTPVTLELGGKNPAIVDLTADIRSAAKRIAWGKFLNAGQTCVAPDYVLVDSRAEAALTGALVEQIRRFFGDEPAKSPDFGRVVSDAHFARLANLLEATKGKVIVGGERVAAERYIAPTVVAGATWADPLMQEEIFGPILPLLAYQNLEEVLGALARRDKPLALYLYTADRALAKRVIAETSSGSVCINHNAVQLAVPDLPFGGVGASGMGAYGGRAGFDTFSHLKPVLRRPARAELALMYPPYSRLKRWLLKQAL